MSGSVAAWPFYMELARNSAEMGNLCRAEEECYLAMRDAERRDPEGRHLAGSLQTLACLATARGRFLRAQRLHYRAWTILKSACGADSPEAAAALVMIGNACVLQQKHAAAEPLFTQALALWEKLRDRDNSWLIRALHGLGDVHLAAGRRVAALVVLQRALAVQERKRQRTEPVVCITTLQKLGDYYLGEARYTEAEQYYRRAHQLAADTLGEDSVPAARGLQKLAGMYRVQNRLPQAEAVLARVQPLLEAALGDCHPEFGHYLHSLALIYSDQGRYSEADQLVTHAVAILETTLGPDHPEIADLLEFRANALDTCSQPKAAAELRRNAAVIREKLATEQEGPDSRP